MADSTTRAVTRKPRKPHKTSDTLTPRADGRWCKHYKEITGPWKSFYFRGTEQQALDEWNCVKADILAGREPAKASSDPDAFVTAAELTNAFLHQVRAVRSSRMRFKMKITPTLEPPKPASMPRSGNQPYKGYR
jgi:hypothetical protein